MTTKHRHHNNHDLYEDVERIKAALMDTAEDVRGRAGEMLVDSMETVKERTDHVKDTVADFTAEKPFKSLGIALLVGIGIGYLIKR